MPSGLIFTISRQSVGQRRIGFRIAEHLRQIAFGVIHTDVGDITRCIGYRRIDRVYESFIGSYIELGIAVKHLAMKFRINFDGIFFNQKPPPAA